MARYQSGSVRIHTTDLNGGSLVDIAGVTSMEVTSGTESISDDSGAIYDEVRSISGQVPEISITSKWIESWLTYIGLGGYCIASDGTHPGLQFFGRVLGDCKSPPAAGTNVRYTIGKGLVVLGELSAVRGQDATLSLMIHPLTDGTNAPIAELYSGVTLPTFTPATNEQFTLGVCKVGSVVLTDLQSLTIAFGVEVTEKTPQLGAVWPDSVAVRKVRPVATLTGFDPTILQSGSIPWLGKQASGVNTLFQLKRRQAYTDFYGDAATEHIAITMNGLAFVPQPFSGSGNSEANTVLRVEGVHTGASVPLIVVPNSQYDPTP